MVWKSLGEQRWLTRGKKKSKGKDSATVWQKHAQMYITYLYENAFMEPSIIFSEKKCAGQKEIASKKNINTDWIWNSDRPDKICPLA